MGPMAEEVGFWKMAAKRVMPASAMASKTTGASERPT